MAEGKARDGNDPHAGGVQEVRTYAGPIALDADAVKCTGRLYCKAAISASRAVGLSIVWSKYEPVFFVVGS